MPDSFAQPPRVSARVGLLHPRRDVALAMQHAPDVDAIGALDVEDQVWIARQRPEEQTGKVQVVRLAGRPAGRMTANVGVCLLQGFDEAQCRLISAIVQVVIYGLIHIPVGQVTRDDGL